MKKQNLTYLILFLAVNIVGKSYAMSECSDVSNVHLRLSTHTSNIVNAANTRTLRGGVYQKKELVCAGEHCAIKLSKEKRTVYEPGHPDADRRGYVKYPAIDIREEFAEVSKAAGELKNLAFKGSCRTQILNAAEDVIVQYGHSHILSDVFKYSKNHTLVSWARTYMNGKKEMFDFSNRLTDRKLITSAF